MSGASKEHHLINGNLFGELHRQLKGRPCSVYVRDMRVKSSASGLYTYPDIVGLCGQAEFEDRELDTLLNPQFIVEVLSPSTEAWDRGGKFSLYRRLPSLQEYVLISQFSNLVERYVRQGQDWVLTELSQPDDVLEIPSLRCRVPLRDILRSR